MAKRRTEAEDGGHDAPVSEGEGVAQATASDAASTDRAKPLREERIGRVKAVVWGNQTPNGLRHNVTFKRIFKREGSSTWEQSDSFGRDDLPLLMEVAKRAWLWVYANGQG